MAERLPFDAKVSVIEKMVDDYDFYRKNGDKCPKNQTFKFISRDENLGVKRTARMAALSSLDTPPITKVAFDTRRVDQEKSRNPRTSFQYWHRSQPFIDEDDNKKIETFGKLRDVTDDIKKDFGTDPEWFESYARQLHDTLTRSMRIKQGDLDIFRPQLSYLEQLVYARYRLSMEDINTLPKDELKKRILSKDENLLGRGEYIKRTGGFAVDGKKQDIVVDGKATTQQAIVDAIFGNNNFRKDGEKTVERTITITVRDHVID